MLRKLNSVFTNLRHALVSPHTSKHIYEKNRMKIKPFWNVQARNFAAPPDPPSSGAGGGAGGSGREAGVLGKYGAAQEDGYFYDKQREQLKNIKKKLKDKSDASEKEDK